MATVLGIDPAALKRVTCRKCAHVIEYAEGEVRALWTGTDYGGGPSGARGFSCPKCSQDVVTESW